MDGIALSTKKMIDRRVIPFLFASLLLLWLDRINIGIAALQMNKDLGFGPVVFGLGAGIFFWGYFISEIPSNLILQRVGAPLWIGRIMVTWGIAAGAMAFVTNETSFYVLRFLLGVAEGGFVPGFVYVLSLWYTEEYRVGAVGKVLIAAPLAGVIVGPMSAPLLSLSGFGLRGWQWMLLLEGLLPVIFGFLFMMFMPRGLSDAKWLPAENSRWLEQTLTAERATRADASKHHFLDVLKRPQVWVYTLSFFLVATGIFGLYLWMPLMVKAGFAGLSDTEVGFVSALPFICAIAGLILTGYSSGRTGDCRWHLVWFCLIGGIGLIAGTQIDNPIVGFVSVCIGISCCYSYYAAFWSGPTMLLRGTAAAGGFALINSVGSLGGFFGPAINGYIKAHTGSFSGGTIVFGVSLILAAFIPLFFPQMFPRSIKRAGGAELLVASQFQS